MALKTKGGHVPKAGPKRRLLTETAKKEAAIEENKRRLSKGKVNSYRYKQGVKTAKPEVELDNGTRLFASDHESELRTFMAELPSDLLPFSNRLFQMECLHDHIEIVALTVSFVDGKQPAMVRCPRCGITFTDGTKLQRLVSEWHMHCPEGMDMFDWDDLFTRDKSLWRFIWDEAQYALVSDYIGGASGS